MAVHWPPTTAQWPPNWRAQLEGPMLLSRRPSCWRPSEASSPLSLGAKSGPSRRRGPPHATKTSKARPQQSRPSRELPSSPLAHWLFGQLDEWAPVARGH